MQLRRVEIYQDGDWAGIPFDRLKVGDIFRLWEPVIDHDDALDAKVIAWTCESVPAEVEGVLGCQTKPAMTLPKPVSPEEIDEVLDVKGQLADQIAYESPDQQGS
jgi:hypothetical protein